MEEFDSNYLAWILYKLFYGIDKEVAKNKERSYVEIDLSNNCKYDVFYNYVKILNLMTLCQGALFLCLHEVLLFETKFIIISSQTKKASDILMLF